MPAHAIVLLYLYNAGRARRDPKVRMPLPIDPKVSAKLLREDTIATSARETCPFEKEPDEPGTKEQEGEE
jgi:hypothetical protein